MAKSAQADRMDNLAAGFARVGGAPEAEGAPAPVAGGERRWLLLFRPAGGTLSRGATPDPPEVTFDPAVVAHSRRIGGGAVLLYEVTLRPEAAGEATIATLPGGGLRRPRTLRVADLAPAWEQASAGFRLTALGAELDQVLAGARPRSNLPELLRHARELAGELPGDPRAAALLRRFEQAGAG
jgi:hypothetical protein